jgi:hypothetical protein
MPATLARTPVTETLVANRRNFLEDFVGITIAFLWLGLEHRRPGLTTANSDGSLQHTATKVFSHALHSRSEFDGLLSSPFGIMEQMDREFESVQREMMQMDRAVSALMCTSICTQHRRCVSSRH